MSSLIRSHSEDSKPLVHLERPVLDRGTISRPPNSKTPQIAGRIRARRQSFSRRRPPVRFFALALTFSLVLVGLFSVLTFASDPPPLELRGAIVINGNNEFTVENGVRSGEGTLSEPYIISDWEVRVDAGTGIYISNTDRHFIIRNVQVNATSGGTMTVGIYLYYVVNGWVDDTQVNDTGRGLRINYCDEIRVTDLNLFDFTSEGILIQRSSHTYILSSDILGTTPAITADAVTPDTYSRVVISSNTLTGVGSVSIGLDIMDYSEVVVQNNTLMDYNKALNLYAIDSCQIKGNTITSGQTGITLDGVTNGNVSGNFIDDFTLKGIHVLALSSSSSSNEIYSNIITNCEEQGILMESSSNTLVINNTLRNNSPGSLGGGVTLTWCSDITLYGNRFTSNDPNQAYDDSTDNFWDGGSGINGNYWSDYTGGDSEPDGIGDVPYSIPAAASDQLPLVNEAPVNLPPVAVFTASSGPYVTGGDPIDLDASGSWDPSTPGSGIVLYRWDWEGDGVYDRDWSSEYTVSHDYWYPGNFTIWLEVMDTAGLCNLTEMEITVTGDVIPEFSEIIIPVTIMMAVFFIASRRRRKE